MNKFLIIFGLVLTLSALALIRTDQFSTSQIYGPLLDKPIEMFRSETFQVFDQPYHYLGRGRQCFVYESEDKKWVIKFFNFRRFYFPEWLSYIPLPQSWEASLRELKGKRQGRYHWTFDSVSLAKKMLSQETGIEFLHFQHSEGLPSLQLIGPSKRHRIVDLNQVAFFLQKKADHSIFEKLQSHNNQEELERMIVSILSLLLKRIDLGIADDDRDIGINFGFHGNDPLLIDPGRLYLDHALFTEQGFAKELKASTKQLHRWLIKNNPQGADFLERKVTSLVAEYTAFDRKT